MNNVDCHETFFTYNMHMILVAFWNAHILDRTDNFAIGLNECVCLTNFRLTFNFKSKVSRDISQKQKWMSINIYIFLLLKCHLNFTCLVIHVISISNVSINMCFISSQFTQHVKFFNVRVSWRAFLLLVQVFACQMSKTLLRKYTLAWTTWTGARLGFCYPTQNSSSV